MRSATIGVHAWGDIPRMAYAINGQTVLRILWSHLTLEAQAGLEPGPTTSP